MFAGMWDVDLQNAASVMRFVFEAGETLPSKRKWSYS